MFHLIGVSKTYDSHVALQPTTLRIEPRQTTVFIGPSGCGKSTLLRLMVGLIQPDAGSVEFDNTPLNKGNLLPSRQRMGYVIQDGGLFPHLTARQNVTLAAHYLRYPVTKINSRVQELTDLTHLESTRLQLFPAELSGGQRQRVSLMRALMLDPAVLLLDEPLGALDPMIRRTLQIDLKAIFKKLAKTVVLVTHDLREAVFFADTIVLLRDGKIVQQGPPQDLLNKPADPFVTEFVNAQRDPIEVLDA